MDHVGRIQEAWRRERPDLDVRPQGTFGRLHRLAATLLDELAVVYREHGLGDGEFDVLASLRRAGEPFERAPGELAAHTMVTSGATTKRIDRLERQGYVTRRQSDLDGRGRIVALTPAGLELVDELLAVHLANEASILAPLTSTQRNELALHLGALAASVEGPAHV